MHEKSHIIKVLEQVREATKNRDVLKLRELSNQTIHSASIYQDTDSITIAVIIYSISKVIERQRAIKPKDFTEFKNTTSHLIASAVKSIKEDNEEEFRNNLQKIRKNVNKFPRNFKKEIEEVFRKASLNKAAKIYEHGISMEQTAELLGLTLFELATYSGQKIQDVEQIRTTPIRQRIKLAMEFFK